MYRWRNGSEGRNLSIHQDCAKLERSGRPGCSNILASSVSPSLIRRDSPLSEPVWTMKRDRLLPLCLMRSCIARGVQSSTAAIAFKSTATDCMAMIASSTALRTRHAVDNAGHRQVLRTLHRLLEVVVLSLLIIIYEFVILSFVSWSSFWYI